MPTRSALTLAVVDLDHMCACGRKGQREAPTQTRACAGDDGHLSRQIEGDVGEREVDVGHDPTVPRRPEPPFIVLAQLRSVPIGAKAFPPRHWLTRGSDGNELAM